MSKQTPILVIERDQAFRAYLCEILEREGFQNIHRAGSLMEATTLIGEGVLFDPEQYTIVESSAYLTDIK